MWLSDDVLINAHYEAGMLGLSFDIWMGRNYSQIWKGKDILVTREVLKYVFSTLHVLSVYPHRKSVLCHKACSYVKALTGTTCYHYCRSTICDKRCHQIINNIQITIKIGMPPKLSTQLLLVSWQQETVKQCNSFLTILLLWLFYALL